MSIASLKLDESAKLEFDVLITGADGIPNSRFVIEGKEYSISFPCRQVNEGIEVDIAGLKNVLPAGEYPVRLEVVLENKIYTPMQDTIKLEPIVEVNTKTKAASQIKESVKVVGKVSVTKKPIITESMQRQIEAATDVAAVLQFTPSIDMNPVQIIEAALSTIEELPRAELIALEKLLMKAESLGLEFNRELTPTLLEAKKVEVEEDDEEEKKEVKDTSDYKLSSSGKKVRAHKIVFNKGEEEPHQSEEVNMDKQQEKQMSEARVNEFAKFVSKHGKKVSEDVESMTEEQLMEVLKKSDPAGKWISDFVHSDNPKFKGKTKKERMQMALGAYYAAQRNEEAELDAYMIKESGMSEDELFSLAEKYMGFSALTKALAAKGAKNPPALAAWIGRKKYGKEKFQAAAAKDKKMNESSSAKDLVRRLLSK